MGRIIGAAEEFYRLRVTRLDETAEPDLEWRDDILYRQPPVQRIDEHEDWMLEAVTLDIDEAVTCIGRYGTAADAHEELERISEVLGETTKSQFESRYFDGSSEE